MLEGVMVGGVDYLEQQVGTGDLFKGGSERIDELVWQLMDEPHGVGNDGIQAAWQPNPTTGWVQGGEQAILRENNAAPNETIEQR